MVGDHLALDLINTTARQDGEDVEFWHSGEDVLRWLALHDIAPDTAATSIDAAALLTRARALRALAQSLIARRKEGVAGELDGLNDYLHAYVSAPHLARNEHGEPVLSRSPRGEPMASLLGPVAEAVALLLVEGDFALVKQCEHPDCILWFYDRTKAHKRRWCSMALCGNRHKAAQFRKRSSA